MKKATWLENLQYQFDNYMAKGTAALIGGLGVISVIIISGVALIVWLLKIAPGDGEPIDFWEAAWSGLMRTLDAGTMGGDEGWAYRFAMFVVTLGGVFIISTLIGILTSAVQGKLEELRKGRSKVIESGHTVILGWSSQVFTIISELVTANENQKNSCIVILGDKDKVEMEDEIHNNVESTGKTRVVCRSGNPIGINDLKMASLQTSKSIILLSQEKENPDAEVIKTLLAIVNNPERRPEPYHIVVEIRDPKNQSVAEMVGQDEIEVVQVGDIISRIIAQTCRQSGLSVVYTELLDFGGDEIYMKEEPALVGKTFGDSLMAYEDSTVIGLKPLNKIPLLNPPMDTVINTGDQIVAVTEDDDTLVISGLTDAKIDTQSIMEAKPARSEPEKTIILGWNWHGKKLIRELDSYVSKGSNICVVSTFPDVKDSISELSEQIKNASIDFHEGDTTDRQVLDRLNLTTFDHVIILCYSDYLEDQEADAATLMTLLHLRDISSKSGKNFSITSEMLDVRNRTLAEITEADDFIISDKIISLMLSQVSENKNLNVILQDIFDPEGSEIYLKPVENYIRQGVAVNFYTVVEAARRQGHVAIGYRLKAIEHNADKAYGVVVNPDKSVELIFDEGDKIIVIAED